VQATHRPNPWPEAFREPQMALESYRTSSGCGLVGGRVEKAGYRCGSGSGAWSLVAVVAAAATTVVAAAVVTVVAAAVVAVSLRWLGVRARYWPPAMALAASAAVVAAEATAEAVVAVV